MPAGGGQRRWVGQVGLALVVDLVDERGLGHQVVERALGGVGGGCAVIFGEQAVHVEAEGQVLVPVLLLVDGLVLDQERVLADADAQRVVHGHEGPHTRGEGVEPGQRRGQRLIQADVEAGTRERFWVKTSTGYGTSGATFADLELMRRHSGPGVQVKAAGGIRDLAGVLRCRELGISRVGASATQSILDEYRQQLGLPPLNVSTAVASDGY